MNDYYRLLDAVEKYYGSGSDEWREISLYGITSDRAESILKQVPGVNIVKNANGKIRSYNFKATENITSTAEQAVNSNVPATIKSFDVPADTGLETVTSETGETVRQMTFKSGMKQAGSFVFGEIAPALAATATGITLGKTLDKLLYNVNPDFFFFFCMSTLDPNKWGDIIGTDTAGELVLNTILGTTPDHKTQAYIDENALAYMAMYLQLLGVFSDGVTTASGTIGNYKINEPVYLSDTPPSFIYARKTGSGFYEAYKELVIKNPPPDLTYVLYRQSINDDNYGIALGGKNADLNGKTIEFDNIVHYSDNTTRTISYNTKIHKYSALSSAYVLYGTISDPYKNIESSIGFSAFQDNIISLFSDNGIATLAAALYGNITTSGGIDGIGTQDDAKTPDLSDDSSTEDVLKTLKDQYPELWDNAISQDVVQPDGTVKTYTYVPVAMPDIDENGNPISSTSTQADPQVQPETATKTLLDLITKIIQRDPPVNPPDTGDGDTPPVVPPSGSASSLYAIYNPTLSQINAFGAWLWSDNFVDQIKKLFNDPMQAIIGLHKVYATPATGGSQTIKVGYLDSGVSSRVVSNQYTTID